MGNARSVIKRLRFPLDIMLLCVRWYVAHPLSLRNLEEMMQERGVFVDHSTIHRWIIKLVPVLEEAFRKRKRKRGIFAVGKSWRLDETYIKIRGEDRYWYRAVDKQGNTVDFLLTAKRDRRAARRFFTRAVKNNRLPEIVNIDKSGANNAGIKDYNRKHGTKVVIRHANTSTTLSSRTIARSSASRARYKASRTFVVRESFWVASTLCTWSAKGRC